MSRPHERMEEVRIHDCKVRLTWDEEAAVWVATSKDVPGLVLEDADYWMLKDRVNAAIQELRELNDLSF